MNRIRVEVDECPDLSYLAQSEAEYLRDGPILIDGREIPYDEYRETYGDPANYVSYGVILERQCDMGAWHSEDSVWGCDVYDGSFLDGIYGALAEVPEGIRWAVESHFPDFK